MPGRAQHSSAGKPATSVVSDRHDPDKSSFPLLKTTLPVSRPQALAKTKLTGKRVEYDLTINEQTINITGKPKRAMTVNGGIPGPTLRYTEGDTAVIRVHNKLKTEASIHWHGLLVPNIMDGVSYLETPPIKAGQTHTFTYPIVQSGTYWYHSHTAFQEQVGVYGSIAIQPQSPTIRVDHDLVMVLSDWTNENPAYILKNLKRRNEWYSIKKGNVQSLNRIIKHKAVGAYLRQSMQRMAPMDISDVYYQRFLINGKDTLRYPDIKPGQTVRLRVINAGSSTYFHLNYAGGPLKLIAADGVDVQPVAVDRRLIAIAETYDFLITVPSGGAFEVRASAQDGSGYATALLGSGPAHYAPTIPKPDLYKLTQNMSRMGGAGMGTMNVGKTDTTARANMNMNGPIMQDMGQMSTMDGMSGMEHGQMKLPAKPKPALSSQTSDKRTMSGMDHGQMNKMDKSADKTNKKAPPPPTPKTKGMKTGGMDMSGMNLVKDGKMDMFGMDHGAMPMPTMEKSQIKPDAPIMPGMKKDDQRSSMDHSQMGSEKPDRMPGMQMDDKTGTSHVRYDDDG